jgi:hypothetical protein
MSGNEETWIQQAEKIYLFRNTGKGAEAARLLEISSTNRILIDRNQAIILMVGRLQTRRMVNLYKDGKYSHSDSILNDVEEHQLTMDGKSREQFMKVAIAQYQGGNQNKAKAEMENLVK